MIRARRLLAPTMLGLSYFVAASAAVALTRFNGGVAFLWFAGPLLIASLTLAPRRRWGEHLIPCAIASWLATGLFGLGWALALPFVAINMIEAVVAAYALRRSRNRTRPLGSLGWLLQFVIAVGVAGPLIAAAVAATVMAIAGYSANATFWTFLTGHALGNITFTPLALLALRGDLGRSVSRIRRRDAIEVMLMALTSSAITVIVFVQQQLPLLFLPILPIILATFRLGRSGAAAGIVILAVIGGALTVAGFGPIQLVGAGRGAQMMFFQFYLAATVLTLLPVAADLSRRARMLRDMRLDAERFRLLAEHSTDILMHLALDGTIRFVSPSIRQLGGYDPESLIGLNCRVLIAADHLPIVRAAHVATIAVPGTTHSYEYLAVTADGENRWFETHARAIVDDNGEVDGVLSVIRDISARKATEHQLSEDALTDMLTGLPNRRAFRGEIGRRIAIGNDGIGDCLAMIDIDHFKRVNDTHGHDIGDEVLRAFARVAARMLRHDDMVARVGGEEFAILFPQTSIDQAMLVCDRLRAEVAATSLVANGTVVRVTISGGVAPIGEGGLDLALKVADEALYRAKNAGRDQLKLAA